MASELTDATRRALRARIRPVMIGVAAVAGIIVAGTWMIDEGEIVKITTHDARGREHVTELWIVDLPSGTYLRSGREDSGWLTRVRNDSKVVLERGEQTESCRAEPLDSSQLAGEVARAMADKYGLSDRLWELVADRSSQVPVRLVGCGAAAVAH